MVTALLATSCGGSKNERTIRVDFRHDEFASHYWRYFPKRVEAHAGDRLVFDQEWTGEPHTVTFGAIVDRAVPRVRAVEKKYESNEPQTPAEIEAATEEFERAGQGLPVFDSYIDLGNKAAVRPCYLDSGTPPQGTSLDRTRMLTGGTCPKREQPAFSGRQAFYSSGFIPPAGPTGNVFRMSLAGDIKPGTYNFYCVIHYPDMQGQLVVKGPDEPVTSQSRLNAQARKEIEELARPLREAFAAARADRATDPRGQSIELPIAGYHAADQFTTEVDEFVPKTWKTKVNVPVTWTISGAHTVSFGAPRYVPIYRVDDDGTVERNSAVDLAAGGSPKPPPVDFTKGPVEIDGGTWDGSGLISSGLLGSEPVSRYTLRVSKAGTYRYACLVHPRMVGTLVVEP